MNPLGDALRTIRKDWKLLAGLNALYFCVLVIGVSIALISPGTHRSIAGFIGSETIAGSMGIKATPGLLEALEAAGLSFSSGFLDTLIIAIPSVILPIWGPIFGAAKFFIWGVAYAVPYPGGMTLPLLLPQYLLMIVLGEAYILAIFTCVRQLGVAIIYADTGLRRMLIEYIKAILDNLKLFIVVVVLLAVAALYQALIIPVLNGFL